jgi:glutamate racemase
MAREATLPIAVFDSGVGGLTVLHECLVSLPNEDFVYLGDTARFPYGPRSRDQLEAFALELAELLLDEGAKALVVACNSAAAAALPALREQLADAVPLVAVVRPEARLAARATSNGQVGLLATAATVESRAYEVGLAEIAPDIRLTAVACPALAPFIQDGGEVDERVVEMVGGYCAPLREADVDTVILGCTHYPLVRPILQRALGRGVRLVSAGEAIAAEVERALDAAALARTAGRVGEYRFLCSGDPEEFRRLGTRFLQMPLGDVRRVEVRAPLPAGSGAA